MVKSSDLPLLEGHSQPAYRLVNSKFPPIALFDDVASEDDFEALYQIQAITNPRLQNEIGSLELIARDQIPFGIPGCSYAIAPFTHVNPAGSRFSSGGFGVLYLADRMDTAIAEVRHHQQYYWSNVAGLNYERFVFRGLTVNFSEAGLRDATVLPLSDPIYAPDDYSRSNALGAEVKQAGDAGIRYRSVRAPGNICWALLTPRLVTSVLQAAHFEMVWSGQIISVSQIKMLPDR